MPKACLLRRHFCLLPQLHVLSHVEAAAVEHTLCYSVRCTPCNVRIDICHPHVNGRASQLRAPRPSRLVLLRKTKGASLAAPATVALFLRCFCTCLRRWGRTHRRLSTRWHRHPQQQMSNHVARSTFDKGRGPPLPIP